MRHATKYSQHIGARICCIMLAASPVIQSSAGASDTAPETDSTQPGQHVWARTFGSTRNENVVDICRTSDGGYVIAGSTAWSNYTKGYAYLLRLSASGEKVWCRTYGGDKYDAFSGVTETPDRGFIAAGWSKSFGTKGERIYLVKTDPDGVEQWRRIIGDESVELAMHIQATRDGGYVIGGFTGTPGVDRCGGEALTNHRILLVKIDGNGQQEWRCAFGGKDGGMLTSLCPASDGGFMLVGTCGDLSAGGFKRGILIKTDGRGNKQFSKVYAGELPMTLVDVKQTRDGGYIAIGSQTEPGAGPFDIFLLRTDSQGTELWRRTYGTVDFFDVGSSVLETPDGHFVVAGMIQLTHDDAGDLLLMEVDAEGEQIWQRRFADEYVADAEAYEAWRRYIHRNCVEAGLVREPEEYLYSSAHPGFELDSRPEHLRG